METRNVVGPVVEGYLVLNDKGTKLTGPVTDAMGWADLNGEGGVWNRVYTREEIETILEKAKKESWEIMPTDVVPAVWDGEKVRETGFALGLSELPPLQEK